MSKQAEKVKKYIRDCFPNYRCVSEYYVNFRGEKLFFDYLIDELNILVEVQGEQHYQFVPFFHQLPTDFKKQKERDKLKEEWASLNGYTLVKFEYNDKINKNLFMNRISEAFDE